MPKILLIEDDLQLAQSLKNILESDAYEGVEDYTVDITGSAADGLERARQQPYEVVVTDLHLSGGEKKASTEGLDLITTLHAAKPQLPIILMTGDETTQYAIEAIKLGAFEYILKGGQKDLFNNLLNAVSKAVASHRMMSEPVEYGDDATVKNAIIGSSRPMQQVYKDIGRLAATPVTVLIRGETGTGKELVARALHQHSDRKDQPFIAVNCAAIPGTLLESELFGHERGAFTGAEYRRIGRFEQANGGTIFLDEIGDMTTNTQAKLLRVLQEKHIQRVGGKDLIPVDMRVIAATHRDLEQAIREHKFREDLYYRLNVAAIEIPALRDRREDIPALVNHFLRRFSSELGLIIHAITPDTMTFLQQQPWSGNVRELENIVCKALLLAQSQPITTDIIRSSLSKPPSQSIPVPDQTITQYVADLLQRAVRDELQNVESALSWDVGYELYKQAIQLAAGNQVKAAKWLGVSRPTMREKLRMYGLLSRREPTDSN
jgi:DNA-binding NtrC family response regulator